MSRRRKVPKTVYTFKTATVSAQRPFITTDPNTDVEDPWNQAAWFSEFNQGMIFKCNRGVVDIETFMQEIAE
jgi:hypothetical protein